MRVSRQATAGCGRVGFLVAAALSSAVPWPASAQVPPPSRDEVMRKWDADRNGTVDASEAEAARARMRRERVQSQLQRGIDPLTGKPRTAGPSPLDRGASATPGADDGGLLLVPGTGEQSGRPTGGGLTQPARAAPRDEPALPGTRAPTAAATIPSVAPKLPTGVPSRERPPQAMPGRPPATGDAGRRLWTVPKASVAPATPTPPGRQPPGSGPGIISGGVRAGGMPARPGYGSAAAPPDINAGRLPAGLPQTRGTPPGGAAARPAVDPQASRTVPGRQPLPGAAAPWYGRAGARGPMSSAGPSVLQPYVPLPQIAQPSLVRPRQLSMPSTTPVVPRLNKDGF